MPSLALHVHVMANFGGFPCECGLKRYLSLLINLNWRQMLLYSRLYQVTYEVSTWGLGGDIYNLLIKSY